MAESIQKMMEWLEEDVRTAGVDEEWRTRIMRREEILDHVQEEIVRFIGHVISGQISHTVIDTARRQLRLADEYESLSDYIVFIAKGIAKIRKKRLTMQAESLQDLQELHTRTAAYVQNVHAYVEHDVRDCITHARTECADTIRFMKECRRRHLTLIVDKNIPPQESTVYMNILNYYRRICDHTLNIAEIIAREK